jgi:hypothetical protein
MRKLQKFGKEVTLRLADGTLIDAEIVQINDDEKGKVIIFKITNNVEDLLEYRKISVDVIWWSCTGWKISNSALIEKDDLTYIKRTKAGIEEEILVKVLRQNDTYSIVENYTDDELINLGFTTTEIQDRPKVKLYDEIMLQK